MLGDQVVGHKDPNPSNTEPQPLRAVWERTAPGFRAPGEAPVGTCTPSSGRLECSFGGPSHKFAFWSFSDVLQPCPSHTGMARV